MSPPAPSLYPKKSSFLETFPNALRSDAGPPTTAVSNKLNLILQTLGPFFRLTRQDTRTNFFRSFQSGILFSGSPDRPFRRNVRPRSNYSRLRFTRCSTTDLFFGITHKSRIVNSLVSDHTRLSILSTHHTPSRRYISR
jgi:hypothetical protein